MKKILACILLAVALFVGCAKPPDDEFNNAIRSAQAKGIDVTQEPYATMRSNAELEINLQKQKFFQNYDRAKQLIKHLETAQPNMDPGSVTRNGSIATSDHFCTDSFERDGHTYIVVHGSGGIAIVHSGNCR